MRMFKKILNILTFIIAFLHKELNIETYYYNPIYDEHHWSNHLSLILLELEIIGHW